MSRKQAFILIVLLAIFAGALYLRLSVTLGHWLPSAIDGPYYNFHVDYLIDHYPLNPYLGGTPPLFFHFAAWVGGALSAFGVHRITSLCVATSLASGLVAITTFLMMRRLTKNNAVALVAALLVAFIPASMRMMEFRKNALGVSLAPLSVLFFWRGLEGGKKLDLILAGVVLGAVGLSHQLAFGTLVIAYISYLAFLLAYRRRIPWRELKAAVVVAIPAALVCGWLYYGALGGFGGLAGGGQGEVGLAGGEQGAVLFAQGGGQPQQPLPQEMPLPALYEQYVGRLLLVLAAVGAGVGVYRRRPTDFFLLAWGMSALITAQPWVIQDYWWRFTLMLGMPMALLAAVGLVEGIGGFLRGAGQRSQTQSGRRQKIPQGGAMAGRALPLVLVLLVAAYQIQATYAYSQTEWQFRPTISIDEYNALVEFRENFGEVYAFAPGPCIYWPDAVGLKGVIQEGALYRLLPALEQPDAMRLAVEWDNAQKQVGGKIYAISSTEGPGRADILENQELFVLVFSHPNLRAYALRENFTPPPRPPGPGGAALSLAVELQPPREGRREGESPILKLLLAPVYVLPGNARFAVGVPLTVLMWVLLPCLVWEGVKRRVTGRDLETLRKVIVVVGVCILVFAVLVLVGMPSPPRPPGP